jgi:hypothetical protein
MPKDDELEIAACIPRPVAIAGFNPSAVLPHGLTIEHLRLAMSDFVNFLGFINTQLHTKEIERLETMLMPANFSSIVGEFMGSSIPKYCSTLAKNQYHNGHPDLIPAGRFPNDAVQHADEGIEIKASRYLRGWQGHNPEDAWLMVFVFDSNRPVDATKGVAPKPFHFVMVVGARLTKADWLFSGRSETSRRTITASVTKSGYAKMLANWIYKAPDVTPEETATLLEPPRSEL